VLFTTVVPPGIERVGFRLPAVDALRGASVRLFTSVQAGATVVEQKPQVADARP
jgi:hypothetical protein